MTTEQLLYEHKKLGIEAARMNVLQLAMKVFGNSGFGALSNKYFAFYDNRIAEGITKTGQYIIKRTGKALSDYISTITNNNIDYNIYSDTDSSYVCLSDIVDKYFPNATETQILNALDKFIQLKLDPLLDKLMEETGNSLCVKENVFKFKREVIASKLVFLAKKRYMMRVLDNEGVRYSEPDIKITGIETQRSSTPDLVRGWLVEAIRIVLELSTRDSLVHYIERRRNDFSSYSVEEIAFPRSVNNMIKFTDSDKIYSKGTPIAVRAALLYNNLVRKNKLEKELELIKEGQKILYIALKEPNTLRENIIGFPMELPKQFNLHRYVDYETQFQKAFLDPLIKIMEALKWELEESNDLDSFFN